jgi:hypothetical protein
MECQGDTEEGNATLSPFLDEGDPIYLLLVFWANKLARLLPVFWANKVARESGHVAGLSRPSDQPNQWSRSGTYRSFCKKALELNKNNARGPGFFHMNP